MKALLVLAAALMLPGCVSSGHAPDVFARDAGAAAGAGEAARQQDPPGCPAGRHPSYQLAGDLDGGASAFKLHERYAQLDDPTRDWTRERQTGRTPQCPPAGRRHRYFA